MAEFNKHSFILFGSTALVVVSLVLSLMTWIVYVAAYVGKLGDAAELPLVLIVFGTPLVALPGLVFTIKTIELRPSKTWRAYFAAAIVSSISAIVAVVAFYVLI